MILSPFTLLLVMLAFLAGLVLGALLDKHILHRQHVGEAMVANTIADRFHHPHTLLNNITIPINGDTTQIDHVLVTDTGIFVIETKHYAGWIFGTPDDSTWTQVLYKSRHRFQNPLHQNQRHIRALQQLLPNLPLDAFHSLVVFTGNAQFKTNVGSQVLHLHSLIPFLEAYRPLRLDERQMAYVIGRIEMKRLRRSLETDEYHHNALRRRHPSPHCQPAH